MTAHKTAYLSLNSQNELSPNNHLLTDSWFSQALFDNGYKVNQYFYFQEVCNIKDIHSVQSLYGTVILAFTIVQASSQDIQVLETEDTRSEILGGTRA